MSNTSTTHILERDTPPFQWVGTYTDILKNGGDKFPILNTLRDLLSGKFRVVLKVTDARSNLYVNGKPCLVRKSKFEPITVYPNCRIIEGDDLGYGGSNSYPHIAFKKGYAIVEVFTNGFPHMELDRYDMKIEILELEKLEKPIKNGQ